MFDGLASASSLGCKRQDHLESVGISGIALIELRFYDKGLIKVMDFCFP